VALGSAFFSRRSFTTSGLAFSFIAYISADDPLVNPSWRNRTMVMRKQQYYEDNGHVRTSSQGAHSCDD
jgi:hypothetical protein